MKLFFIKASIAYIFFIGFMMVFENKRILTRAILNRPVPTRTSPWYLRHRLLLLHRHRLLPHHRSPFRFDLRHRHYRLEYKFKIYRYIYWLWSSDVEIRLFWHWLEVYSSKYMYPWIQEKSKILHFCCKIRLYFDVFWSTWDFSIVLRNLLLPFLKKQQLVEFKQVTHLKFHAKIFNFHAHLRDFYSLGPEKNSFWSCQNWSLS